MSGEHTCYGCGALEGTPHIAGCARAHSYGDLVAPVDVTHNPFPPASDGPTAHQLSILNALVTYTAENVPGGLSPEEADVAKIVGGWALKGKIGPQPCVTVELKSVRVSDHEADEEAWSVVVSGPWGDTTFGTWTSRPYATCEAECLTVMLKIVLGDASVELELP